MSVQTTTIDQPVVTTTPVTVFQATFANGTLTQQPNNTFVMSVTSPDGTNSAVTFSDKTQLEDLLTNLTAFLAVV